MTAALKLHTTPSDATSDQGLIDALNRVQAVIEFDLEGNVLTANANFLNALGYSLDEIQGHHHRMFCDPAYTASPEYQAFWKKLARGEFETAEYRRPGKGGKEAWINASYNPVFGEDENHSRSSNSRPTSPRKN